MNKKIAFFPQLPNSISKIRSVCEILELEITDNIKETGVAIAINWNHDTVHKHSAELAALSEKIPVLNLNCTDVSKSMVNHVFEDVFGYSSFLNPEKHYGACVVKSERQAAHDGTIILCPTEPEDGKVYQKLIDTRISNDAVMDIRVPVFGSDIPLVFLKKKPILTAFRNKHEASFTTDVKSVLSEDEQSKIIEFCQKIGCDYGELDILRNNSDGRIYIIDVNNIAGNAIFRRLQPKDSKRVQNLLAQAFKRNFLDAKKVEGTSDEAENAGETEQNDAQGDEEATDIVYVYTNSTADKEESEIIQSIRSIEKHAKFPYRIVIVGDMPSGLNPEKVYHIESELVKGFSFCKAVDAAAKLHKIANDESISDDFVYMYDDIIFVGDVELQDIGILKANAFYSKLDDIKYQSENNWSELHRKTFEILEKKIKESDSIFYDGETHLPRLFKKHLVLDIIEKYNLLNEPLMFNSLYINDLSRSPKAVVVDLSDDHQYKAEISKELGSKGVITKAIKGKMFLNFNNIAYNDILKQYLWDMFPEKSAYEL